jgi:hypothetical protein
VSGYVDARRLEGLLKALWFGESWMGGWRPCSVAPMGDLVRLALRRVHTGFVDDLGDLPGLLTPGVIVAPLWLASWPRPEPRGLGAEPLPALLTVLGRMESWPGLAGGGDLATFLARTPRPTPTLFRVHVSVLRAVEPLFVTEASAQLADPTSRVRSLPRLLPWFKRDLIRTELVLALHAFEAAGGLLSLALKLLREASAPPLASPLAALLCEVRTPGSMPASWLPDLRDTDLALLDAVCLGRSDEVAGALLAVPRERRV